MSTLEVRNLHKRYGAKVAVDDVSFAVEAGEIFGILGPNGAGKTTTVECVAGLRDTGPRPDPRAGARPAAGPRPSCASGSGVQLQESRLPDKLRVARGARAVRSFYRSPADAGS